MKCRRGVNPAELKCWGLLEIGPCDGLLNADQHFGHRRCSSQILAFQSLPRLTDFSSASSRPSRTRAVSRGGSSPPPPIACPCNATRAPRCAHARSGAVRERHVRDAFIRHGDLEPVGVGDDPVRPKSARAMADHPEPCRIRDPEAHHVLDAGHVVEVTLSWQRRAGGAHRLGAAAIDALPAFRGTDRTTPT